MIRSSLIIATLFASVWVTGCNKTPDPNVATNSGATPTTPPTPGVNGQANSGQQFTSTNGSPQGGQTTVAPPAAPVFPKINLPVTATPDVVVSTFLDQIRQGNGVGAADLLTTKAREVTAKAELSLNLEVVLTMKFSIAKVEYLEDNKDAAYVNSVWTEELAGGEQKSEIVWVMRRQTNGWRVAGMSAQNTPDQPPVWLNFEDEEHVAMIKENLPTEPDAPTGTPGNGQSSVANGNTAPNGTVPNGNVPNGVAPNGFAPPPNGNGFAQPQPLPNGPGAQPFNSAQQPTQQPGLRPLR